MGLFDRSPRNADVIATSPMRVIKLTHWEIRRMSEDTVERIRQIVHDRRKAGVSDPGPPGSGLALEPPGGWRAAPRLLRATRARAAEDENRSERGHKAPLRRSFW